MLTRLFRWLKGIFSKRMPDTKNVLSTQDNSFQDEIDNLRRRLGKRDEMVSKTRTFDEIEKRV